MSNLDKAPLHIVIVLGILSWTFTQVVDAITARPIIAYEISRVKSNEVLSSTYSFRNISKTTSFKDFELQLIAGTDTILSKNYDFRTPLIIDSNSIDPHENHLKIKIPNFQPDNSFSVTILTRDLEIPIRYRTENPSYLLPTSDYQCLFLDYEIYIYTGILTFGILILVSSGIWFIISLFKSQKRKS